MMIKKKLYGLKIFVETLHCCDLRCVGALGCGDHGVWAFWCVGFAGCGGYRAWGLLSVEVAILEGCKVLWSRSNVLAFEKCGVC